MRMKVFGKMRWLVILCLIVAALLLITMLSNAFVRPRAVVYTIPSGKLSGSLRLALITDLHSARYGRNQSRLMAQLEAYAPDAVLLCGDIYDGTASLSNAAVFCRAVGAAYPCYFVLGNHEYATHELETIRQVLEESGITVLEGDTLRFSASGTSIRIAGVDDVRCNRIGYEEQLAAVKEALDGEDEFSVLLSHEPQYIDDLLDAGADLIVSGHTHGGQISLPGVFNGLYSPGQGLFPKYAGGLYAFGEQTLVISRGLSKLPLWAPRIFTPRELVLLDLVPES